MATRKNAAAKKAAAPAKPGRKPGAKGASGVKARADKAHNPWAGVALPEGFQAVTNGDYGQDWDYEAAPILIGKVVGEVRTVEVKRGRVMESQRVVTVDGDVTTPDGEIHSSGPHTVWDSASLHSWFDTVMPGMGVAVVFQGYREVGKGSPMKMFLGSIDANDVPEFTPAPAARGRGAGKAGRRAKA